MAGKHVSIGEAGAMSVPSVGEKGIGHPADRLYRAYSEGREKAVNGGDFNDNPFPTTMSEQRGAWNAGVFSLDAEQYETAYPDVP